VDLQVAIVVNEAQFSDPQNLKNEFPYKIIAGLVPVESRTDLLTIIG